MPLLVSFGHFLLLENFQFYFSFLKGLDNLISVALKYFYMLLCYLIARKSVAGISMEGDEELLAQTEVKVEPKRDEWMTTLPPERKVSPVDHLILCTCANYTKCSRT